MIQTTLLPERIRRIDPNPVASADSPGIGVAYSGQRYVLKVAYPAHPRLPACEWLCHALGFCLGLPVPIWCACELPDGRMGFGSRFEGGVVATQVPPTAFGAYCNPEVVAHTLCFDLFVGNDDRHPGNWLPTRTTPTEMLLRPIDFSRALLLRWPMVLPPWGQHCNSHLYYQVAAALGHCPASQVLAFAVKIEGLGKPAWRTIVESVPGGWLDDSERRELVNWWLSPMWHTRLKWIKDSV